MSKELAIRESYELTNYTGATGLEGFGVEDVSMPWLRIAAKNTDAAIEGTESYIDGLKPGQFFIPSQKLVIGKVAKMIVLKYFKSYGEYTPGTSPKFVRAVSSREVQSLIRVGAVFPLANGNVVKESFNYLVILPEHPEAGICRFSMGAGSAKHVKNWNGMMIAAKAPIFAIVWEVGITMATGKDGDTYFSIGSDTTLVKKLGFIGKDIESDVLAAFEQAQGFDPDNAAVKSADGEYDTGPL